MKKVDEVKAKLLQAEDLLSDLHTLSNVRTTREAIALRCEAVKAKLHEAALLLDGQAKEPDAEEPAEEPAEKAHNHRGHHAKGGK